MRLRDALPSEIITSRLRLRQPVMSDLDALVEGVNNWKVIEPTASLPFPYLPEHGIGFIERFSRKPEQRPYAIARQDDDRLIGIVGLKFSAENPPELGYWIGEPQWGQGFAPEAVTGLLAAAGDAGMEIIRARVLASNPASQRVLEKTGFAVIERTESVVERHRGKPLLVLEWRR
ncbi:GNAT family N-acetyltransferase [Devosia soli]|uniref:GNAT family N-acetyltransferase n=1 Tax=Devosia soli TaxID=361041 RepID=UPI00069A3975|nr:GNAT family N-acetyltransferase [Devosia soli]